MNTHKVALMDIVTKLPAKLDLFICCASFESRCRSVVDHLTLSTIDAAVIFHGSLSLDSVQTNVQGICDRLSLAKPVVAKLDAYNPILTEDVIASVLQRALDDTKPKHLLVDITTFTREFLFILLNHLRRIIKPTDTVTLAYVGAAEYSSTNALEHIWLSQGVRTVRSVVGFPGESLPSRPLHLIILAGFESDRAGYLVEHYEPAILSVGYGPKTTSITEEHHRANLAFHQKLVALYQNVQRFEFPPNDPIGTWLAVKQQISLTEGSNVILAALNTKLSAVGAALAAFDDPNIQLCYAQADIYNYDNYSKPAEEAYLFDFQPLASGGLQLHH